MASDGVRHGGGSWGPGIQPITASRKEVRALATKFKSSVWLPGVHPSIHYYPSTPPTSAYPVLPPAALNYPQGLESLCSPSLFQALVLIGTRCSLSLKSLSLLLHLAASIDTSRLRSSVTSLRSHQSSPRDLGTPLSLQSTCELLATVHTSRSSIILCTTTSLIGFYIPSG